MNEPTTEAGKAWVEEGYSTAARYKRRDLVAAIEAEAVTAEHERAVDACARMVMAERARIAEAVQRLDAYREPLRRDWEVSLADVLALLEDDRVNDHDPR